MSYDDYRSKANTWLMRNRFSLNRDQLAAVVRLMQTHERDRAIHMNPDEVDCMMHGFVMGLKFERERAAAAPAHMRNHRLT